ncbi:MAG: patatin-like phospholipase family protein [Minisyncoccia bacterium]|jgi:NTE family protein
MKKVGLALGSGGVRGLAHLGVIKTLEQNEIPIDFIAGSSIGALIGGLYAVFKDTSKIEKIINDFSYRDFITIFADIDFKIRGIVKGEKALEFLRKKVGNINIEDLKIPFRAVATDINSGEPVIFDHGDLIEAIRASGSVPGIFKPMNYKGKYLIDGGISMPVPVEVVKKMGSELVIAVTLDNVYIFDKTSRYNINKIRAYTVAIKSLNLLRYNLAYENIKGADIVIAPEVKNASWLNFVRGQNIIKIGEEETRKYIPLIKQKLSS